MKFNKLTIIDSIVFLFILSLTIFHAVFNYKGTGNISLILMALAFNISIGILIILSINFSVKFSKKGIRVFILYVMIISFLYWYFLSTFFNLYYGTYLSVGGLAYFIATRTYTAMIIFYLASGFVIFGTTSYLYFLSRKYLFKDQIQRVVNKKIKILILLVPIFIIIIVLIAIPKSKAFEASPLMEALAQVVLKSEPQIRQLKISQPGEKLLPISLRVKKPNFIVILLESISAERLPIYGYERNTTPNLKKIAKKSIIFDNAYSSSAHSDYAQTAFLSSRYALTNDYRNFFNEDYPRKFLWDILKEEGYNTAYISSQDDNWANMIEYYKKENLDYYYYSLTDGKYDYGSGNSRKDYDEVTANKSIQWLNNQSNKTPFYLYVNFQGTHHPYEYNNNSIYFPDEPSSSTTYFNLPKSDYQASINDYDNSINYVDKQIGKIYDHLKDNKLRPWRIF
jgi:glucan phosphoethanolaminetransferase (alkaline phosphatase superfamily)